MTESIQINLEAFQANLNGARILLQGPFQEKCPPILEAIQNIREPFKKRILLTSKPNGFTSTIQVPYDTYFRIITSLDWSLALNYINNLIGQTTCIPLLVVIDSLDVPDAFFAKIQNNTKITVVHYIATPIKFKPSLSLIYDTIFFPFQIDVAAQQSQNIFNILQSFFRPSWTFQDFREIMTEIRTAGAGLCWSRYGTTAASTGNIASKNGNIYWYDPVHTMRNIPVDKIMLADILRWIAGEL